MQPGVDAVYVPSFDIFSLIIKIIEFIVVNLDNIFHFLGSIYGIIIMFSIPISFMLLIGIIISVERVRHIREKEKEIYDIKVESSYDENAKPDMGLGLRWRKIVEQLETQNENDWKQSIIDADKILAEILEKMGYRGDGIGEKLKRVEKADFQTLDQAWEAHKIRNIIAHEGETYVLTQREAKRVINLYKQVFDEFYYI